MRSDWWRNGWPGEDDAPHHIRPAQLPHWLPAEAQVYPVGVPEEAPCSGAGGGVYLFDVDGFAEEVQVSYIGGPRRDVHLVSFMDYGWAWLVGVRVPDSLNL